MAKLYIVYVIAIISMIPQLKNVYQTLNNAALVLSQETDPAGNLTFTLILLPCLFHLCSLLPIWLLFISDLTHHFSWFFCFSESKHIKIVQHFLPSCRSARMYECEHLASARLLRSLDDHHMEGTYLCYIFMIYTYYNARLLRRFMTIAWNVHVYVTKLFHYYHS